MTFGDFKNLDYPDSLPVELVLEQEFFLGHIDFLAAMAAYTRSLERERHKANSHFNEAACVLTMGLSGNWNKPKDKKKLCKRAIHILNLNRTFTPNIYNEEYGYTEEDKNEWDKFTEMHYGNDFNK